jgi:hypothetical protein
VKRGDLVAKYVAFSGPRVSDSSAGKRFFKAKEYAVLAVSVSVRRFVTLSDY